jgi:hypothetical protein
MDVVRPIYYLTGDDDEIIYPPLVITQKVDVFFDSKRYESIRSHHEPIIYQYLLRNLDYNFDEVIANCINKSTVNHTDEFIHNTTIANHIKKHTNSKKQTNIEATKILDTLTQYLNSHTLSDIMIHEERYILTSVLDCKEKRDVLTKCFATYPNMVLYCLECLIFACDLYVMESYAQFRNHIRCRHCYMSFNENLKQINIDNNTKIQILRKKDDTYIYRTRVRGKGPRHLNFTLASLRNKDSLITIEEQDVVVNEILENNYTGMVEEIPRCKLNDINSLYFGGSLFDQSYNTEENNAIIFYNSAVPNYSENFILNGNSTITGNSFNFNGPLVEPSYSTCSTSTSTTATATVTTDENNPIVVDHGINSAIPTCNENSTINCQFYNYNHVYDQHSNVDNATQGDTGNSTPPKKKLCVNSTTGLEDQTVAQIFVDFSMLSSSTQLISTDKYTVLSDAANSSVSSDPVNPPNSQNFCQSSKELCFSLEELCSSLGIIDPSIEESNIPKLKEHESFLDCKKFSEFFAPSQGESVQSTLDSVNDKKNNSHTLNCGESQEHDVLSEQVSLLVTSSETDTQSNCYAETDVSGVVQSNSAIGESEDGRFTSENNLHLLNDSGELFQSEVVIPKPESNVSTVLSTGISVQSELESEILIDKTCETGETSNCQKEEHKSPVFDVTANETIPNLRGTHYIDIFYNKINLYVPIQNFSRIEHRLDSIITSLIATAREWNASVVGERRSILIMDVKDMRVETPIHTEFFFIKLLENEHFTFLETFHETLIMLGV